MTALAMMQRYRAVRLRDPRGHPLRNPRLRRQREMETLFNLGRAWHFVGILNWASECYWGVLRTAEAESEADASVSGDDAALYEGGPGQGDVEMVDAAAHSYHTEGEEQEEEEEEAVLYDEPDFRTEAALALQPILVHSGDAEGARRLAERFLVF